LYRSQFTTEWSKYKDRHSALKRLDLDISISASALRDSDIESKAWALLSFSSDSDRARSRVVVVVAEKSRNRTGGCLFLFPTDFAPPISAVIEFDLFCDS